MIIRSQDKTTLCNTTDTVLTLFDAGSFCRINLAKDHDCFVLGTYNSKAKCIEVLDKIQDAMLNGDAYYNMP